MRPHGGPNVIELLFSIVLLSTIIFLGFEEVDDWKRERTKRDEVIVIDAVQSGIDRIAVRGAAHP